MKRFKAVVALILSAVMCFSYGSVSLAHEGTSHGHLECEEQCTQDEVCSVPEFGVLAAGVGRVVERESNLSGIRYIDWGITEKSNLPNCPRCKTNKFTAPYGLVVWTCLKCGKFWM